MARTEFEFSQFFADSLKILSKPSEYFSGMNKEGGFRSPVIRALLYGTITAIINFLTGSLHPSPLALIFSTIFGGSPWFFVFISTIILHVIGLFIMGILILLLSAVCRGNTDYEASVHVAASLMVMQPVKALISAGQGTGFALFNMIIITLFTSIYSLYLLYNAIIHALGGKKEIARVISVFLLSFPVLMLISSFMCINAVKDMTQDTGKLIKELPKADKEMRESIDKLKKMMEERETQEKSLEE